jgi:hypothetical protein
MFDNNSERSKDFPSIMEEETLIQKNVFIQRPAMNQVNFKRQLLLFVSIVVVDVKISTE